MAGLGGDGGEHVADVAGRLALGDEQRPVREDQALVPLTGDVAPGRDAHNAGNPLRGDVSILTTTARGWSLKRTAPWSMPGTVMSRTNGKSPSTRSRPS